jgi:hypothetical protein
MRQVGAKVVICRYKRRRISAQQRGVEWPQTSKRSEGEIEGRGEEVSLLVDQRHLP